MLKHGFMPAQFQSTPPVKAATLTVQAAPAASAISIHAAREGGDRIQQNTHHVHGNFNPRRP